MLRGKAVADLLAFGGAQPTGRISQANLSHEIRCRGNLSLELYGKVQSALRKGLDVFVLGLGWFSTRQVGFG